MWDRHRHVEDSHLHDHEQHMHSANLLFRNASEPNLCLSPPPSRRKSGRVAFFKQHTMGHDSGASSPKTPMRLPIGLLEYAKSSFRTHINASQISLDPSSSSDMSQIGQCENDLEAMAFRAEEKPPRLPSVLCVHNDWSSLWQSVYSTAALADSNSNSAAAALGHDLACPTSPSSSSMSVVDSSPASRVSSPGMKGQNRAFIDTVFTSMTRSSPQSPEPNPKSSPARTFYSGAKDFDPPPDPFGPHATTYYAPPMISATPPGPAGPADLIFLLKTQLVLQTELRRQLETDLRGRDELVKVLGKKLAETELADMEQLTMLKQCKKKVKELECLCRSRRESMQRSIIIEAGPESLQIVGCYLAGLQREKESWTCVEETLRKERERHTAAIIRLEREKQDLLAASELQKARLVAEVEKEYQLREHPADPSMLVTPTPVQCRVASAAVNVRPPNPTKENVDAPSRHAQSLATRLHY
ncbi:hypothetical protein B0H13DRAFT_709600 [Mycena leptocephala]|nr:hypothetical protein B0H13DRAFT_709600 [Mycena leptocephala]